MTRDTAPAKDAKYAYLTLSFKLTDPEKEIWETLFTQDKAVVSVKIYSMVAREMPALAESAERRQSGDKRKAYFRRLFLLPLPEYGHVIRFIQSNLRRPAFKDHLKRLILYGDGTPEQNTFPASNLTPETATGSGVANLESTQLGTTKRSPQELFPEPTKLLRIILIDLGKPEEEREFAWDTIPPDEYPEAVRKGVAFGELTMFWNELKKTV